MPIYLGAFSPGATALAAELADGWMPTFYWPERAGVFAEPLQAGERRRLANERVRRLVTRVFGEHLESERSIGDSIANGPHFAAAALTKPPLRLVARG